MDAARNAEGWRVYGWLAVVVLAAFGIRVAVALRPHTVQRDGIVYAAQARAIVEGEAARALDHDYPPGYAALVAGVARVVGADGPPSKADARAAADPPRGPRIRDAAVDAPYLRAGALVAAILGGLTAVPVFFIARRVAAVASPAASGAAAGLLTAALLAIHPHHVVYSAHVLSDVPFAFFVLATVAATLGPGTGAGLGRQALAGAGAGLAAGAAYAVRPEGLVALGVAVALALAGGAGGGRGRAARALLILAGFGLIAGPLIYEMNLHRRTPSTAGIAEKALPSEPPPAVVVSKKKDPGRLIEAARGSPATVASNALRNAARTLEVGHPLLMALALAGGAVALRRGGAGRRAALAVALLGAAYLAVASLVRVDRRFALVLSAIVLPLAAPAAACIALALANRVGRARAAAILLVLVGAATVPVLAHEARDEKVHLRACATLLRLEADDAGLAHPVVLAGDMRIAYYAGGMRGPDPGAIAPADLAPLLRAGPADFIVETEDERFMTGVARAAGVNIHRLDALGPPEGERGETFVLYRIERIAPRPQ